MLAKVEEIARLERRKTATMLALLIEEAVEAREQQKERESERAKGSNDDGLEMA